MNVHSRKPGPLIDDWTWQHDGACRELDTEMFFYPEGERGVSRRKRARAAKTICSSCPVLEKCREHALLAAEPYGVWGGMTEEERRGILQVRAVS